jgi:hypothetical protein
MSELWRSPEATILALIESFHWIKDAGLSDQFALETLVARIGDMQSRVDANTTIRELIMIRLSRSHPSYSSVPANTLDQQVEMAHSWVMNEIRSTKIEPPFPPMDWLQERVNLDTIKMGNGSDWRVIKMRITERDELWTFSSPGEYWKGLGGRAGVALIRNGRPIAHVVELMN